jgi:hypothetical protein
MPGIGMTVATPYISVPSVIKPTANNADSIAA